MDGDVALVQRWLDDGLFVDKRDNMQRTPLHQACWSGRLAVLRLLLGAYAEVDARDKDQCTPLHYAATTDQVAIVQELLLRKADVNARDLKQETPLYKACMLGNPDVVECLLSAGADPSLQDINGKPPAQEFNTKVTSEARERVNALVGKVVEERAAARTALKAKQAADDEQFKRAQQGCCSIA
eukprot:17945-Heterococcus_DN1.PRE.1